MATHLSVTQKTRIGVFFFSALLILLGALGLLFGRRLFRNDALYTTRFTESVAGVEVGSPVRYLGLNIGHVSGLGVARDDAQVIEVTLSIDAKQPLHGGTTAAIDGSGLMGAKTINLMPGDRRQAILAPGSVLASRGSLFGQLEDHATAIVTDVRRVADQLVGWASTSNRERVESVLDDVGHLARTLAVTLTEERPSIHRLLVEGADAAQQIALSGKDVRALATQSGSMLHQVSEEVQKTAQALRLPLSQLDPKEMQATLKSLRTTTDRLGERLATNEAGRAIKSFTSTVDHVDHLVSDLDLTVRAGREDLTTSLAYLRQAAEDLREFTRLLAANPSVLVRGRKELP